MAKLNVYGNLTADAQKKETTTGKPYWKFTIIENETDRDGNKYSAPVLCVSYKEANFKKGDFVEVTGKFEQVAFADDNPIRAIVIPKVTIMNTDSHQVRIVPKNKKSDDAPFEA